MMRFALNENRMTTQTPNDTLDESAVAEFLKHTPDFFERHLDLLKILHLPHPSGSAISLVERQLGLLREHNRSLEDKLHSLVEIARDNQRITDQLHAMATALVEAQSLSDVLTITCDVLRQQFAVDFVSVKLFEHMPDVTQTISEAHRIKHFSTLMELRRPVCGRLTQSQEAVLFDDNAPQIQSSAMIPLANVHDFGVLGLGSPDEQRFSSNMGVFYLEQLGALISGSMVKFLPETKV